MSLPSGRGMGRSAVASVTVESLQPSVHEGYLLKQGERLKKWSKRWCVLKDKRLYYFGGRLPSDKAKGAINLDGYLVEIVDDMELTQKALERRTTTLAIFRLFHATAPEYLFCATSENDLQEWVQSFLVEMFRETARSTVLADFQMLSLPSTTALAPSAAAAPLPPLPRRPSQANHLAYSAPDVTPAVATDSTPVDAPVVVEQAGPRRRRFKSAEPAGEAAAEAASPQAPPEPSPDVAPPMQRLSIAERSAQYSSAAAASTHRPSAPPTPSEPAPTESVAAAGAEPTPAPRPKGMMRRRPGQAAAAAPADDPQPTPAHAEPTPALVSDSFVQATQAPDTAAEPLVASQPLTSRPAVLPTPTAPPKPAAIVTNTPSPVAPKPAPAASPAPASPLSPTPATKPMSPTAAPKPSSPAVAPPKPAPSPVVAPPKPAPSPVAKPAPSPVAKPAPTPASPQPTALAARAPAASPASSAPVDRPMTVRTGDRIMVVTKNQTRGAGGATRGPVGQVSFSSSAATSAIVACVEWINSTLQGNTLMSQFGLVPVSASDLGRACSNGLLLCQLVNVVTPGTLDSRALTTTGLDSQSNRADNIELAVNSARSVGCQMGSVSVDAVAAGSNDAAQTAVYSMLKVALRNRLQVQYVADDPSGAAKECSLCSVEIDDGYAVKDGRVACVSCLGDTATLIRLFAGGADAPGAGSVASSAPRPSAAPSSSAAAASVKAYQASALSNPDVQAIHTRLSTIEHQLATFSDAQIAAGAHGSSMMAEMKSIMAAIQAVLPRAAADGADLISRYNVLAKAVPVRVNQANKAAGGGAQVIVKNQGTSCAKCSQPLQGEIVDAFGSTFHKACFGCTTCNLKLSTSCLSIDGKPYCDRCGKKAFIAQRMAHRTAA